MNDEFDPKNEKGQRRTSAQLLPPWAGEINIVSARKGQNSRFILRQYKTEGWGNGGIAFQPIENKRLWLCFQGQVLTGISSPKLAEVIREVM